MNTNSRDYDEAMLFDFGTLENTDDWLVVNDGVMGGLSKSMFILSDNKTAVFSGNVSLENNGGFASTRTKAMRFRLDGFKGILVRVKGDGKKYQFRIRTDDRLDGVSYRYHFETGTGQWQTIAVPFDKCEPVFRGRILPDVEPVSQKDIQQVGFLISDRQSGDFRLEVQWMKGYR